ncbi:MAG: lipocalin family protein [Silicimonas sp.]
MAARRLRLLSLATLALCAAFVLPAHAQAIAEGGVAQNFYEDVLALGQDEDFVRLSGSWDLQLPEDFGFHPAARSETWTLSAHLATDDGRPVNVQFSLARLGLRAAEHDDGPFALRDLFRAHVIVISGAAGPVAAEERFARSTGAAGHDGEMGEVWIDNWQLGYGGDPGAPALTLSVSAGDTPVALRLTAERAALPQNTGGEAPLRGFVIPRLSVTGSVGDAQVTGTAWLDRFWGEVPLPGGPLAYDRLVLQLDDGTDVSLLRTRRRDGGGIATLDGAAIGPEGQVSLLSDETLDMTPRQDWRPKGGTAAYPIGWTIRGAGLDLTLTPLRHDQRHAFLFPVWSGGVRVDGTRDGNPVTGVGTLQLTGYEDE